ncbi:MAG TPA: methyltransferase domain-containing protein [Thermotogota bacterium]|nr:methyltransferase domain-containing protein [Thermotogota bacterium]HRW34261.1 methyltransferase domain-containing protein [Thermotogota bacterium]
MFKPEQMNQFFNIRVDGYDEHMRMNVAGFEKIYTAIANPIPSSHDSLNILDLGCGTGLELAAIFQKAPNALITGIDLSKDMLRKLEEKYISKKTQLSLIVGSYLETPFPNLTYDIVLSVMTLHHLTYNEKSHVYDNIYKSLKNGGIYIEGDYVVDPIEAAQRFQQYKTIKETYNIEDMHNYHVDIPFTKKTQIELFHKAGFQSVDIEVELENACVFSCKKNNLPPEV